MTCQTDDVCSNSEKCSKWNKLIFLIYGNTLKGGKKSWNVYFEPAAGFCKNNPETLLFVAQTLWRKLPALDTNQKMIKSKPEDR